MSIIAIPSPPLPPSQSSIPGSLLTHVPERFPVIDSVNDQRVLVRVCRAMFTSSHQFLCISRSPTWVFGAQFPWLREAGVGRVSARGLNERPDVALPVVLTRYEVAVTDSGWNAGLRGLSTLSGKSVATREDRTCGRRTSAASRNAGADAGAGAWPCEREARPGWTNGGSSGAVVTHPQQLVMATVHECRLAAAAGAADRRPAPS